MEGVIVFGGSFDPVHQGHLGLAEFVLQETGLQKMIFLPAARSPFKPEHEATFEQRCRMLRIALEGSGFGLDLREGDREGPSYTVRSLEELARELKLRPVLLLGEDNLPEFGRWKDPRRILELADLLVINRPAPRGETAPEPASAVPHRNLCWPGMELSSTWLRRRMASGKRCRYLLPPGVWEYIVEQGLYGVE